MAAEKFIPPSEAADLGTQVLPDEEVQADKPPLYRVVLLNDDYTPMDFVVWVVETVFHKSKEEATRLMWDVHTKGRGVGGIYPYDIARTKAFQAKSLALKSQHPLECILEVEER